MMKLTLVNQSTNPFVVGFGRAWGRKVSDIVKKQQAHQQQKRIVLVCVSGTCAVLNVSGEVSQQQKHTGRGSYCEPFIPTGFRISAGRSKG